MNIITFTPIWGRYEILEIWLAGLERLMRSFDITPAVIVSCGDDFEWVNNYMDSKTIIISTPNSPLGRKQNIGLRVLRYDEFDYIMQLSSDLLITDAGVRAMIEKAPAPVIAFRSAYFIDAPTGDAILFTKRKTHKSMGACRMISRDTLASCNWRLWDDEAERNMDHFSQQRMGVDPVIVPGTHVVGIKSKQQLTSFDHLAKSGEPVDMEQCLAGLSDEEIDLIKSL